MKCNFKTNLKDKSLWIVMGSSVVLRKIFYILKLTKNGKMIQIHQLSLQILLNVLLTLSSNPYIMIRNIWKFKNLQILHVVSCFQQLSQQQKTYLKDQLLKIRFAICVPKLNMVCVSICTCDCKPFMNMHADSTLYCMARLVLLVKQMFMLLQ